MSRRRRHPVFTASAGNSSCGHQHSTPRAAINCCANLAKRERATRIFYVNQYNETGAGKIVERLQEKDERCTECGQRLIANEKYELGHLSDCPLVTD